MRIWGLTSPSYSKYLTLYEPARGLIGTSLVKSAVISKMGHPIFVAQTWLFLTFMYGHFKPFLRSVSRSDQFLWPFSSRRFQIFLIKNHHNKNFCENCDFEMAVESTISFENSWGKFLWVRIQKFVETGMINWPISILILKIAGWGLTGPSPVFLVILEPWP
jgi:hypothetical protein